MGDSTKPTITHIKVTFSDGKVEEVTMAEIKIPGIIEAISAAVIKGIEYLKTIGKDRYK